MSKKVTRDKGVKMKIKENNIPLHAVQIHPRDDVERRRELNLLR